MFKLFISKKTFSTVSASFKILGVSKGTPTTEIKKRYYELAKQYHPDVNKQQNAHQKFAQITKAYNLIIQKGSSIADEHQSNSTDSQFYKNTKKHNPYQTNSQKRSKAAFQEDWQDFETFDEYYRTYKKFKKSKRGEDIYINMSISLTQSFNGGKKKAKFTRKINCSSCSKEELQTCISCGGKGEIFHRKNKQKIQCTSCSGFGYKLDCQECSGSRTINKDVEEEINIQKDTHDKSILRVRNNGHQGYKHMNGDLYVTILIQQTQKMRIDGNNIHSEIQLQYLTAVFGGQIQIETVQGIKSIDIPSGTQSGHEMRLFNYGVKSAYSSRVGDHIIKFKIKVPKKLSIQQQKLMNQLSKEEIAQSS